ncbi:MAG: ACP S-malonyltransferase [Pseudomonadales bacterium]|nr:ACP S-malonyltransferase [Pseudomonadales bacterium]MCP5184878.1 ACP S-malonyltransferase [Pseudomonadales bacterium]
MSLGVVFPGQGSQSVGMLLDTAAEFASVRERFQQAGDAIGIDLWRIVAEGPVERLNQTEITQPALLTASVALWDILIEHGARVAALAGHSLGEYSALVAGGALDFSDAVRLVHRRGQLMQSAVPAGQGAMAAVLGLDDAEIASACASVSGIVAPANFNAVGQTVIAGEADAVSAAGEACKAMGARRVVLLDVSVPSHCPLMEPVASGLAEVLDAIDLRLPGVPVIHNVDAAISTDTDGLKQRLLGQLANPVRWVDCVKAMAAMGVTRLIECGPGNVLSGLVKRIDRSISCDVTTSLEGLRGVLGNLHSE